MVVSGLSRTNQNMTTLRAGRRRMPGERIAQHLSERAPTDAGHHVYIHTQEIGMRQELGLVRSGAAQFAA